MTAEILIMNKSAIALAADSAVSFGEQGSPKIYNSVNKLFSLSRFHPIGMMIYNNAHFMKMIPWETIVKEFRNWLGTEEKQTLQEYSNSFREYILKSNLIDDECEEYYFVSECNYLYELLQETIEGIFINEKFNNDEKMNSIINYIKERSDFFSGASKIIEDKQIAEEIFNKFINRFNESRKYFFEKYNLDEDTLERIDSILKKYFLCTDYVSSTGIVIAGFGKKELFPRYIHLQIYYIFGNKLVFEKIEDESITVENHAVIKPFAQNQSSLLFINGISPSYRYFLQENLVRLFYLLVDFFIDDVFQIKDDVKKDNAKNQLHTFFKDRYGDFTKQLDNFQNTKYFVPLYSAISALPKDKLAELAESLINLEVLRKVYSSNEKETVGGPIDVAVISKGDGFIWIKRKHYFKPELNPHYFANNYHINMEKLP